MSNKIGIIKGLDDGFYSQAKVDGARAIKDGTGEGQAGPLWWLTGKVLEEMETSGKDHRGRDIDAQKDLRDYVDRYVQRYSAKWDSPIRRTVLEAAALETYGIQRELAARDIRPERGDTGAKFFGPGTGATPLFPAALASTFITSRISAGLIDLMVFADITMAQLHIDKVRLNEGADDRRMRNVDIGSDLPTTELSHLTTTVPVRKYGRSFIYAREVVEVQPLNVIMAFIEQIARQVAADETDEALEILHAGDGETGSAVTDTTPATDGTLAYGDIIKLELAFANGYAARTYLCTATQFQTILEMAEYKDPLANRGVSTDRNIPNVPTPSGMGRIWRWQSTLSTYMAESGGRIAAVDPTMACYIARSPLLDEQDDIIRSGKREVALSYRAAVVKGDPACFQSLDITA